MEANRLEHIERQSLPSTAWVLGWLAHRHADVVDSARVNGYLWRNLASPVDVVDLDLVALAALAMRLLGVDRVMETMSRRMELDEHVHMESEHLRLAIKLI